MMMVSRPACRYDVRDELSYKRRRRRLRSRLAAAQAACAAAKAPGGDVSLGSGSSPSAGSVFHGSCPAGAPGLHGRLRLLTTDHDGRGGGGVGGDALETPAL
jgi:hypothetical protein